MSASEIFSNNLAALENQRFNTILKQASDLDTLGCHVEPSRTGDPTLYVSGMAVHSRYDPVREANKLASKIFDSKKKPAGIVIIGLGLGYLAEAIIDNCSDTRIIIIEPKPEIIAVALKSRDLTKIISQCEIVTGYDPDEIYERITSLTGNNGDLSHWQLVVMQSARKYANETTGKLETLLNRNIRLKGKRLRIMVVGPLYGGSLPVTGYVVDALRSLGHRVELLDNSVFNSARIHLESVSRDRNHQTQLQGLFTTLMAESVTARALDMKAQLVFFMAQSPATPHVLEELRSIGIPTAFWFVEDGSLFEYGKKIAPFFDIFFHIQKGQFEKELLESGARYVHYLPMAADPEIHRPLDLSIEEKSTFGSDISHVGAGYFNRRHFFLGLLDHDFKLWGNDWDKAGILRKVLQREGERISTEDCVKIFNSSKINLNLHSSTYTEGVNPKGDFVNPRTFELAASGAFQIVDERSLLSDLFQPGKEIITFNNLTSCRDAINYYLSHEDEARKIASASRERVLKEHTYRHRMEEALGVILSRHEPAFPETPLNTVESLIEEAGSDKELAEFFEGMGKSDDELTLEGITEKIKEKNSEPNETEAIFLLMNEFYLWAQKKGVA
ncbi:MAG: glycosyltransferase [Candidatus Electryonea clarkiae]|nr:glycosyltransferase [Candidatus Electryonea clarkiae]MDP8285652.1 glycosyltransferase [Candidatus Electryonea clarkiae]